MNPPRVPGPTPFWVATGMWASTDVLRWLADGKMSEMVAHGHYHESHARTGGEWKVTRILLTRLRTDIK